MLMMMKDTDLERKDDREKLGKYFENKEKGI